jgi:hypothetical protein
MMPLPEFADKNNRWTFLDIPSTSVRNVQFWEDDFEGGGGCGQLPVTEHLAILIEIHHFKQ